VEVKQIIAELDKDIARLKEARALLAGATSKPGRRGKATASETPRKRNLTPEGRKRISEALKRRWAAQRKGAGKAEKAKAA
jgi:hypothetical protein